MRSWFRPMAIALTATLGCDAATAPTELPLFTATQFYYDPGDQVLRAFVVAEHRDGPTRITCHLTVQGAEVLSPTALDTLGFEYPLPGHPRDSLLTSSLGCVAAYGGVDTSLVLTVDTSVADVAPVLDTMVLWSYTEPIDSPPWQLGIYLDVRDDWRLKQFTIELSDSLACPCRATGTILGDRDEWFGSFLWFVYTDPGPTYVHLVAEDDAGQKNEWWRGPVQVPLPATAPRPAVLPAPLRH